MSAVTRAGKLELANNELTAPAETCIPENREAPPVVEGTGSTGIDSGSISDAGMTPLMRAACDGSAGTVRSLLDRGADVNAKRSDGFKALTLAAFFGHSHVVWLLMENGADLAATGRSETLPEMWADARGFFDIAYTLREARVTEQLKVSSLSSAVIHESARFSRPAENEKVQRASDPGTRMEAAPIDEATNSEAMLALTPAPVVDETFAGGIDWTAENIQRDKSEHPHKQPIIEQKLRTSKSLPEIDDPPPLLVPRFNPASVFVARITSSRNYLVALILVLLLVSAGLSAFLFPQIRKWLRERRTEVVSNTANLTTDPGNPVAGQGTKVSRAVDTTSPPVTEPTNPPASKDIAETPAGATTNSKRVEATSQVESAEVSEKGFADTPAPTGSESRAHPWSDNKATNTSDYRRDSTATSVSGLGIRMRKLRAVSRAVKFKQQTVAEEQPKPAPLSVETSQSHSVLPTPAVSAKEPTTTQPPPLSIISSKPKSKVIQWP